MPTRQALSLLRATGCKANEIDPGRGVPNNWDDHLVERWEDRKARLAAERAVRRDEEHRA